MSTINNLSDNAQLVKAHLCTIVNRVTHQNMSELPAEGHLVKDLGMDSLEMLELVMECEKEFQVVIPDREWTSITRIQDLIHAISRQLPGRTLEHAA